jgi:hypothetical protein
MPNTFNIEHEKKPTENLDILEFGYCGHCHKFLIVLTKNGLPVTYVHHFESGATLRDFCEYMIKKSTELEAIDQKMATLEVPETPAPQGPGPQIPGDDVLYEDNGVDFS